MYKVRRALGLGLVFVCSTSVLAAPSRISPAPSPKTSTTSVARPSASFFESLFERLRRLGLDIGDPPPDSTSGGGASSSNPNDPPPGDDPDRRYMPTGG